jgi:hypothetical protein
MERAIDPLREENQFLVLARESIDFEIRRNTDASAGGDDYASRILLATFEERIQSFRDARGKPFDAAFEILSDGEFVVYHVGIRHVEVGDDLIIDFRAPIARERFSEAATERRTLRFKEDELIEVLIDGARRGSGLKSLVLKGAPGGSLPAATSDGLTSEDDRRERRTEEASSRPAGRFVSSASDAQTSFIDSVLSDMLETPAAKMTGIVGTIQKDQDALMRLPLGEAAAIQGGPGTGKTVVGLHRLAFVAFEARNQKIGGRLLMLGPSDRFVNYVKGVLPSLGERRVFQKSFEDLCLDPSSTGQSLKPVVDLAEHPETALLKASPAILDVMRRVLVGRVRVSDVILRLGVKRIGIESSAIGEILAAGAGRLLVGTSSMDSIREDLVGFIKRVAGTGVSFAEDDLRVKVAERLENQREILEGEGKSPALVEIREPSYDDAAVERGAKQAALRLVPDDDPLRLLAQFHDRHSDVFQTSDERFMPTSQERVIRRLILQNETPESVRQRRSGSIARSDLPLLHELQIASSGTPPQPYDHIMIDETQNMTSAMLRVVRRYFANENVTLLGDFNQRTRVEAVVSWSEIAKELGLTSLAVSELPRSYRVPKPTLDFASQVLSEADRQRTPIGVRPGAAPEVIKTKAGQVTSIVEKVVADSTEGAILIIAARDELSDLHMSDDRVTTIAPEDANGLEAGLVIVVNPGHWQFDAEIDSRLLYVALTRTMGRLVVVHTGRLPVGLSRNLGPQSNSAKVAQQHRNKKKSSRFKKSRATNRAKKPTKSAARQDPAGKRRRAMFGFKRKKQSKKR